MISIDADLAPRGEPSLSTITAMHAVVSGSTPCVNALAYVPARKQGPHRRRACRQHRRRSRWPRSPSSRVVEAQPRRITTATMTIPATAKRSAIRSTTARWLAMPIRITTSQPAQIAGDGERPLHSALSRKRDDMAPPNSALPGSRYPGNLPWGSRDNRLAMAEQRDEAELCPLYQRLQPVLRLRLDKLNARSAICLRRPHARSSCCRCSTKVMLFAIGLRCEPRERYAMRPNCADQARPAAAHD